MLQFLKKPRWDHARDEARRLADEYSAPPIPVLEIAENNGADVIIRDFGDYNDSVSGFCDFENKKIYVNENDGLQRQAFTMAHELGHWILHRELFLEDPDRYPVLPRFNKPDDADPYEKEANAFAAELLVPKRLLDPVKFAGAVKLASIFGVSRSMMEYRLKNG